MEISEFVGIVQRAAVELEKTQFIQVTDIEFRWMDLLGSASPKLIHTEIKFVSTPT